MNILVFVFVINPKTKKIFVFAFGKNINPFIFSLTYGQESPDRYLYLKMSFFGC